MAQKKPARRKPAAPKKPATKSATKSPAKSASKPKAPARKPTRARKPKAAAPEQEAPLEVASAPVEAPLPEAAIPEDAAPEVAFAARVPPPEPERPRPLRRRAIFFDVENTSRAQDVSKLLEHVAIDRINVATELVASGNWRVIGNETARLLARAGAHLVHSAPATGVRDWSDLRIAVAAGVWLASARPGDQLDIVSDDKAFDVVGDVAATLGVFFRKLSYRAILRGGGAAPEPRERAPRAERAPRPPREGAEPARSGRGRRGGRGRSRRGETAGEPVQGELLPGTPALSPEEAGAGAEVAAATPEAPARAPGSGVAAPPDQLLDVVNELLQKSPKGVMLDTLANRLKALGFERPPGSPRLVTRVRSFKELDVSPRGLIRYRQAGGASEPSTEDAPEAGEAPPSSGGEGRRRRRRGGRRGGGGGGNPPASPGPAPEG